jgi:WD40 repeat protein
MSNEAKGSLMIDYATWRPAGYLVSEFKGHSEKVNVLALSSDHALLASGAEDGRIHVWDTVRFMKHVTNQSIATIETNGKVKSLIFCEQTHVIAYSTTESTIHLTK